MRVYELTPRSYPLYLASLGDADGDANAFGGKLIKRAGKGLGKSFSCCQGFAPDNTNLRDWTKQHDAPAIAAYVNWRGRTVRQICEKAALYDALESYVEKHAARLHGLAPREVHEKLRAFVSAEQSVGRLILSKQSPTPIVWRIKNLLHVIGFPLVCLLLSPLLLVAMPLYIFALRRLEKAIPKFVPPQIKTF